MLNVRQAAVAGMFYPAEAGALQRDVAMMLDAANDLAPRFAHPKVLVVPHAGYVYSGPVAARAYEELVVARGLVKRVVLLGPVHRVPVRGLALPGVDAFDTPLGRVPIDAEAVAVLAKLPQVCVSGAAHAAEHSLEVQLPFLQRVLGEFSLVPLAVGMASITDVAEVLECLWGGPETLIVISTDLSHYHPYEQARAIDAATIARICARETDIRHEEACGATPLNGLLQVARARGLELRLLAACNSGDTAGSRDQVVGYSAFAVYVGEPVSREEAGRILVGIARAAIEHRLGLRGQAPAVEDPAWLRQAGATFVTLTVSGALRGCIGSLAAVRALGVDVAANAQAAAFGDPRFHAVTTQEWPQVRVEVSLLSAPKAIRFRSESDLLAQLAPGEDGLILECGGRRGTFLPQVWESLPEPRRFLDELKRKAGLPAATPIDQCGVSRYRVVKWKEAQAH